MPLPKTKVCSSCKEEKALEDFSPNKQGLHGRKSRCRPCRNKHQNSRRWKAWTGLSYEEVQALKTEDTSCAICGVQEKLVLDHDHKTGAFRGFLCCRHNRALGLLGDDLEGVTAAFNYLTKFYGGTE